MEEKKNNSKGILIVLVLIIIAMAGYIAYKGFVSNPVEINAPESEESIESKAVEEETVTSMAGIYKNEQRVKYRDGEEVMFHMALNLGKNNMYYFTNVLTSVPEATSGGQIGSQRYLGSYRIEGDKLYLYQLFELGNDMGGDYKPMTRVLDIVDSKTIKIDKDMTMSGEISGDYSLNIPKTSDNTDEAEKAISETTKEIIDYFKQSVPSNFGY